MYTPKAELHPAFSDRGELIKPLEIRFTGDISGVFTLPSVPYIPVLQGGDIRHGFLPNLVFAVAQCIAG